MAKVSVTKLAKLVGSEVGVSDWQIIDQERINVFADCTGDHQFIHLDAERAAKETPFGGTIAHGFLTLSMLSQFGGQVAIALEGAVMGINYGFDAVRFLNPVRAGKRIRGRFVLQSALERKSGQWMLTYDVSVEIEGDPKPALAAKWLTMQALG